MNDATYADIGRACERFKDTAEALRKAYSLKKQATKAVDEARNNVPYRELNSQQLKHLASCKETLEEITKTESKAKAELAEHAKTIRSLVGGNFDITASAKAILEQYEEQLRG